MAEDQVDKIQELKDKAEDYIQNGNIYYAMQSYRQILAREPNNAYVWYRLGRCLYAVKEYGNSFFCFKEAFELSDFADTLLRVKINDMLDKSRDILRRGYTA